MVVTPGAPVCSANDLIGFWAIFIPQQGEKTFVVRKDDGLLGPVTNPPVLDCRASTHGLLCNVTKSQSESVSRPERKCVKSDVKIFKRSTPGEVFHPDDEVVSEVIISTNAKVKPVCMVATLLF